MMGGAGSDMIYADLDDLSINGFGPEDDDTTQDVDESIDDAMDVDTVSYASWWRMRLRPELNITLGDTDD